jgi:uncharacterized protein UPF0182
VLGGFLRRILIVLVDGDVAKVPFSDDINSQSRLLMRRNVRERVAALAPLLTFDLDPYIVVRGHYQYYGRLTNFLSLRQFYRGVRRVWRKWLNRRTRGRWLTWEKYLDLLRRHPLSLPRIMHSWATPGSSA